VGTTDPGPVVVVTGASAGVGRAVARAFAAEGASVGLLARGEEGLGRARQEVELFGGQAMAIPLDVANSAAVDDAAALVEREFGPIDIWVNNAFSSVVGPVSATEAAEFRRSTEVTYLGYVYGTLAALRRMRQRGRGTIVQVGSALAYRGIPLQGAYCASKHAIKGFTESLRCELLHERSGVRVTMVQLPAVNTPQFDWILSRLPKPVQPVPPIYQPEVAAQAVLHAAKHPERREYWVGGSTAATLLANRIMPGLLDRYLARIGYAAQQSDREPARGTPNLWEPADGPDGDKGAHGSFDDVAHPVSHQVNLSRHRRLVGIGLGLVGGLAAGGLIKRRTES
jgi:NAD(P)-dependent dehydrogenase (short-subunit alcohol dehydrogenase family)